MAKNKELEKVVKWMPLVTVSSKVFVEGEKTITASDIISFEILIEYENIPKGSAPGYVCSKNYPFLKRPFWYIVIVDGATRMNVIQVERLRCEKGTN